jgi:hypothetical protein
MTIDVADAAVNTGAVWVGNLALFAIFLVSIAFVVVYAFVPWWVHGSGRNVMALMASLSLFTGLAVVRIFFGDTSWFLWLRLMVLCTIPIILGWRLWMLIRVQYLRARSPELSQNDRDDHGERYDRERDSLD